MNHYIHKTPRLTATSKYQRRSNKLKPICMQFHQQKQNENTENREITRRRTILRVGEVDVSVTERGSPGLIPANPNGDNLRDLAEQIIELALIDTSVKIAHIKRRVREGACTRQCRSGSGGHRSRSIKLSRHWSRNHSRRH